MRLQKFLSAAGVCSRRRAETYIKEGKVKVNGQVVTQLGTKVAPETDIVEFQGTRVLPAADKIYIALHKPAGYVSSCLQKQEQTVMELVKIPGRFYPVGRLDKDSTGLLLLTNDGRLHHRLSHPSFDHEKEYDVTVAQPFDDSALAAMRKGIRLSGKKTRPAKVKRIAARRFSITLQEGRNRQIRRMVNKLGNEVVTLHRTRISAVRIGNLPEGGWRHLTEAEKQALLS
ncbi:MAG: pseudouridine synthase [Thermodesulfobacteriota bacterium]|nr:pseudouridine synthase [Thermodesulfobacteriota bacterium]